MRLLLDGDQASNNGNWQWIASVGVDPQPAFRRIYNPSLQQERFDPDGRYVRRYVAELAQVPDEYLAEPWRMPEQAQEWAGCRIGPDYPGPVVDHRAARLAALDRSGVAADAGAEPGGGAAGHVLPAHQTPGEHAPTPHPGLDHEDQHVAHGDGHGDLAAGRQAGGQQSAGASDGCAGLVWPRPLCVGWSPSTTAATNSGVPPVFRGARWPGPAPGDGQPATSRRPP